MGARAIIETSIEVNGCFVSSRSVTAPIQRLAGLGSNRNIGHKAGPKPGGKKACCDSPDIQDFDGSKICANCGTEISQQNIVAEVTFGETATGAATVQGGFVGESARHARTFGAAASRRLGGNLASREESENNGRRELRSLAPRLNVPPNVEEVAFTIWKLATNLNFVQGRRTDEVAACCLYAACRRERDNTVLLMDISEILRVNVFALGDIYKDLCKKLMVEVHDQQQAIVDIEPLILKYARKLEFGEKTRQVVTQLVSAVPVSSLQHA
ncbi:transcription factor TFIIIB subunit brf1 [Zalaria obscura]|uniref:Transcription factor TFIIIB subunit brf1 n=1 Tax=Zalaria obscura TaxID=2024903 RepID=A0ACC3S3A7_9PEZI